MPVPGEYIYLSPLEIATGDIAPTINQALQDYRVVELPAGKLPGYLGGSLVAKRNGQSLLGKCTHIEVRHPDAMYVHPDHVLSSYSVIEGLRLERPATQGTNYNGHGIWFRRNVEKPVIRNVHIIGAMIGFFLGPTDDGLLDTCIAERCHDDGFRIQSQGPVPFALQWSSRDCRAMLCAGNGMSIKAVSLAGEVGGVACGTHRGFTTWANGRHGVICEGTTSHPLHEPRFEEGFLGDDKWNEMVFDNGADFKVHGMRLELPKERHGIYIAPSVRHAWIKDVTISGHRVNGTYGIYCDAGVDWLHLLNSEVYNFGASGVYANPTYARIMNLQSADNGNYGLYIEHNNMLVYGLSCYGNGMGDFGGAGGFPGRYV